MVQNVTFVRFAVKLKGEKGLGSTWRLNVYFCLKQGGRYLSCQALNSRGRNRNESHSLRGRVATIEHRWGSRYSRSPPTLCNVSVGFLERLPGVSARGVTRAHPSNQNICHARRLLLSGIQLFRHPRFPLSGIHSFYCLDSG